MNECDSLNGGCQQLCKNQDGGHTCDCLTGYSRNADGNTCSGNVDEYV